MAIFFFVVRPEIKYELASGELCEPRTAALPILAAFGGMVVPAAVYLALNAGGPGLHSWGVPMATTSPSRWVCWHCWATVCRPQRACSSSPSPSPSSTTSVPSR